MNDSCFEEDYKAKLNFFLTLHFVTKINLETDVTIMSNIITAFTYASILYISSLFIAMDYIYSWEIIRARLIWSGTHTRVEERRHGLKISIICREKIKEDGMDLKGLSDESI